MVHTKAHWGRVVSFKNRTDQHLSVLKVLVGNLNVLRPAPMYIKERLCSVRKSSFRNSSFEVLGKLLIWVNLCVASC